MMRFSLVKAATFGVWGVIGGMVAWSAVSHAATVTSLAVPVVGTVEQTARKVAERYADGLGVSPQELVWQRTLPLQRGAVVYFGQQHQGLPVLEARLALTALNGRVVALSGDLASGLSSAFAGPAQLSQAEAIARLQAALPASQVRRASLAISQSQLWGARQVWVLDVLRLRPLRLLQVLIDAQTGALLYGRPAMKHVQGRVYTTNPVSGSLVERELLGLTSESQLQGDYSDVSSCVMSESGWDISCDRLAAPDAAGDYLFEPSDPDPADPFSEVQAYYHVDQIHRWLHETFGFSRQGPQQITTIVNFRYQYEGEIYGYPNAFFGDIDGDGRGDLVLGEDERDFAYDADVIYHEFGHSVVDETSGLDIDIDSLGFNTMPLALNEGFADLLSSIMAGDPEVGEYAGNGAIRSLVGTAACPGDIIGQSHHDGQIWGQANWSIRSKVGDQATFDQILYATLAGLGRYADFGQAAQLMEQVAQELGPELSAAISSEFSSRGLQSCSRILTLLPGNKLRGWLFGEYDIPGMSVIPASVQYRIDLPARASSLRLKVRGGHWGGAVAAFVRRGQPVDFSYSKSVYDHLMAINQELLTLGEGGSEPLIPGESYYVLPVNDGAYEAMYSISYEVDETPQIFVPQAPEELPVEPVTVVADAGGEPLAPDAGGPSDPTVLPADPQQGGGGGGCAVAASPRELPAGLALLLGLAGLLVLRSRRR